MNQSMKNCRNSALAASSLALLSIGASCNTAAPDQHYMNSSAITYVRTTEYTNKINRFRVQPQDAWKLLAEHIRTEKSAPASVKGLIGITNSMVVGDSYNFDYKEKVGGIALTGYYVDGNTGKVEFMKAEGSIPYPKQK